MCELWVGTYFVAKLEADGTVQKEAVSARSYVCFGWKADTIYAGQRHLADPAFGLSSGGTTRDQAGLVLNLGSRDVVRTSPGVVVFALLERAAIGGPAYVK